MIYLAVNRVALDPAFGHLQLVHDGMEIEVQAPTLFFLGADWIYEYRSHDGFWALLQGTRLVISAPISKPFCSAMGYSMMRG